MASPPFTTAADYHEYLFAQADEQAAKLAGKVEKLQAQLDDARAACAAALEAAKELRANPPEWVEPGEHVKVRPQ